MHRRMEDGTMANVEITNPMFGGEEFDDDLTPNDNIGFFNIEVEDKVRLKHENHST